MASEYCWMEPANGCRICMRILSGERARLPGFGLTEGSLVATCGALRLHLDILQLGNGTQNYRDSDGIDRYPGASGPRLHIGFRRRCTMASIQPGLTLRKATFYEGENCGGLQRRRCATDLSLLQSRGERTARPGCHSQPVEQPVRGDWRSEERRVWKECRSRGGP